MNTYLWINHSGVLAVANWKAAEPRKHRVCWAEFQKKQPFSFLKLGLQPENLEECSTLAKLAAKREQTAISYTKTQPYLTFGVLCFARQLRVAAYSGPTVL